MPIDSIPITYASAVSVSVVTAIFVSVAVVVSCIGSSTVSDAHTIAVTCESIMICR